MASEKRDPVGRRDAFSFVHSNQFYVCHGKRDWSEGGYSGDQLLPLQRFDFSSAQWSGVSPVCVDSEREEKLFWRTFSVGGRGVCCAVLGDCAYSFGGYWKYGYAVHELNLETMVWRRLEPKNKEGGPISKKYAGMVTCGDEALCVFGGYGDDTGRHQPGATYHTDWNFDSCWTNELHLFHMRTGSWSSPETTGPRPPPCAGFSFTKVDLSRVVMFGGKQRLGIMNKVHILDMDNWHWSGAILPSGPTDLWPPVRYLHCACVLYEPTPSSASEGSSHPSSPGKNTSQHKPQLFVLWGKGNDPDEVVKDAWILDVNSTTWKLVKVPPVVDQPCFGSSLGCRSRSATEAELVLFGGVQTSCRFDGIVAYVIAVGKTTLFHLGMKSLYHSCVDYVAERYELYQPLLQQLLPPHIQTDIYRERDKRARYKVAQL